MPDVTIPGPQSLEHYEASHDQTDREAADWWFRSLVLGRPVEPLRDDKSAKVQREIDQYY